MLRINSLLQTPIQLPKLSPLATQSRKVFMARDEIDHDTEGREIIDVCQVRPPKIQMSIGLLGTGVGLL